MRNSWTIARREYRLYFMSPIAYIVALMILLTVGAIFILSVSQAASSMYSNPTPPPDINIVVSPMAFLFLITTPAVTMRLLSEEHRSGTLELMLTAPIRDWELVFGKWLGAFLFLLTVISATLIYPIVLNKLVSPGIDQGIMLSGYLGVILLAAAYLAIGTALSAFFDNQFAAFFATLVTFVVLWWIVGWPASLPIAGNIFNYLSMSSHFYDTMSRGIIALGDIVYYLSLTALGLFLGTVAVEIRRWR